MRRRVGGMRLLTLCGIAVALEPMVDRVRYFTERSREDVLRKAKRVVLGDQLSQLQKESRQQQGPICVTGTTSGIGNNVACELATLGYEVIACGRNAHKVPTQCHRQFVFDLADLEATASAADQIRELQPTVLILNAGVWPTVLEYTVDELELGFQVNHLAQFLLYTKLADSLERVVVLTSLAHAGCDDLGLDDINWEKRAFDPALSYSATKLMNLLFAKELARRSKSAIAVHPGIVATDLFRSFSLQSALNRIPDPFGLLPAMPNLDFQPLADVLVQNPQLNPTPLKTPIEAARDVIYAAIDTNLDTGLYLSDAEPTPPFLPATTDEAQLRLWNFSEQLLKNKLARPLPPADAVVEELPSLADSSSQVGDDVAESNTTAVGNVADSNTTAVGNVADSIASVVGNVADPNTTVVGNVADSNTTAVGNATSA